MKQVQRILINKELCQGCKNCQLACMAEHTQDKGAGGKNLPTFIQTNKIQNNSDIAQMIYKDLKL